MKTVLVKKTRKPLSDAAINMVVDAVAPIVQSTVNEALEKYSNDFKAREDRLIRDHTQHLVEQEKRLNVVQERYVNQMRTHFEKDDYCRVSQLEGQSRKISNQRQQLRLYSEKLELMKRWPGIFRTIGQRFHLCS